MAENTKYGKLPASGTWIQIILNTAAVDKPIYMIDRDPYLDWRIDDIGAEIGLSRENNDNGHRLYACIRVEIG